MPAHSVFGDCGRWRLPEMQAGDERAMLVAMSNWMA
jgi:hypothetical protein